jgi:hypothetical protein
MKAHSSLLFIFSVFLWSCFEAPDFSPVPKIKFEDIYFGKSRDEFRPDSLVISLSFEDGDGDLGMPANFREDPFHEQNFFIGTAGNFEPVGKKTVILGYPRFLNIPPNLNGELLLKRSRVRFPGMVSYNSDSACLYYTRLDSVLLKTRDIRLLHESVNYYEIPINPPAEEPDFRSIVVVKDTFYIEKNPNYQNIDVEFYRKIQDPNNPSKAVFTLVNWRKQFCTEIFDARFPILSSKENALSGTIKYSMTSTQLENIMGNDIWKLRVRIRDRQRNNSNVVESREFTIDEIRR